MPAKYRTDDGRFEVLRPLIECDEASIRIHAETQAFPILPCNLCGSQSGLQRSEMKELLTTLEQTHPNLKSVMLNALRNVRPSHLLDQRLLSSLPLDNAPTQLAAEPTVSPRHRALPIISSQR